MSAPAADSSEPSKLRLDAEARLKQGSAPPTGGWPTGVSALSLLHTLASTPASANDALKLLHELQVHQVELDLQHEQMEVTRRDLAEELARYQGLYEYAPMAYFSVGAEGDILEGNAAAATLFAVTVEELRGRRIESFLAPGSRPALLELLKRLRAGAIGTCEVRLSAGNGSRPLEIVARVAPGGGSSLMVAVETSDRRPPDPSS